MWKSSTGNDIMSLNKPFMKLLGPPKGALTAVLLISGYVYIPG